MRGAAERGHVVIGLGDFNMVPLSLAHRIIETHSPARDVWRLFHPNSSVGAAKDKQETLNRVKRVLEGERRKIKEREEKEKKTAIPDGQRLGG